ncbi:LOW QUALITY PROTEIN: sulfotransferase 1C4 [Nilaparvata lugens]|uniref:LOW QUALITY PROTEIN: sulfotransferase 1C4 n=1 Tax=Nilaparvata lugens TaxID=108931 RepID=UPI00193D9BC4|nr:LOW QUALITY PROTEIN: sulfotransferase 1C4 [Nilaparvata lugens]
MSHDKDGGEINGLPLKMNKLDDELNRQLLRDFLGERTGFLQVGPEKYFFPQKFAAEAPHLYNFKVRSDDTWVVTFPRSGTTWTQELVWLLSNNLDFEKASSIPLAERFPFFEFSVFMHEDVKKEFLKENEGNDEKQKKIEEISRPVYEILNSLEGPRFIKTHLPFSLLPPNLLDSGCKVIYVARNPKDVAVSFYHLNRLFKTQGFIGDFAKYWDYFERNLSAWAPYWSHVLEGWNRRNHPNVLFLFYEQMNTALREIIDKVSNFLEKPVTEEQTEQLMNYLDIRNFKNNPAVNFDFLKEVGILNSGEQGFVRKGKNNGWSEEFTPDLIERADKWIKDNLERTDLRFPGMQSS